MSQENVEIVRASLNALDEGDAETALSYFAEDVVFQPLVAGPYHGRAGVVEQWLTWMDEFDDYWFESEELIDAGDDLVVMLWRQGGEGKSSGIKVENRGATVFTVGDGVIRHARVFGERSEALEAAGLSQ
jgi:ketosteroid isomerase-like protein